ncbi:MAG TPA: YcxB family protein [Gemmataceae bacterium]|nr:YcxB family protein [Gemmataceae bacterium]
MEVEYSLGIDDVLVFHRYHWTHGPKNHRLKRGWGTLLVFVLMVLGLIWLDVTQHGELSAIGIILVYSLGIFLLLYVFAPRFAEQNVRRIYKGSEGKGEFRHRRVTLSSWGLRSISEVGDYFTKWSGIETVVVTDEHLFLYLSPRDALIVPKWAFDDERRFAEFVDQARQYHEESRATLEPPLA